MLHYKIALTAVTLFPSLALQAQRAVGSEAPVTQITEREAVSARDADPLLASWLAAGCDTEVAIARLALRKSQSGEVKKFAQMMLDDHARLSTDLKKIAVVDGPHDSAKPVTGQGKEDVKRPIRDTAEASSKRVPATEGGFDHIALIRDLNDRCRAAQIEMLEALSTDKFDHGFMSAQVAAHTQAIIMTEVFRDHASDGLRPTLERAGKALRDHLEQAKTLCKRIEVAAADGEPSRGSRK
ncbi:MAG: DUF4142 domain-containing protein [Planctomycetota bacterium]